MKLDRSRSYGTVHGGGLVAFVQDGRNFDAAGEELIEPGSEVDKKAAKPRKGETDQVSAQLQG